MNTPIKLLLVAAVSVLFGSGCFARAYDPAVDGDWDQYEARLNDEIIANEGDDPANAGMDSPDKPDPTPWVEDADPSNSDPTPWEVMNGAPGKPDPTPWRAGTDSNAGDDSMRWFGSDGAPGKPDPTPWRSLGGDPDKPDPTPWEPTAEGSDDVISWVQTGDPHKPDPTPWRYAAR